MALLSPNNSCLQPPLKWMKKLNFSYECRGKPSSLLLSLEKRNTLKFKNCELDMILPMFPKLMFVLQVLFEVEERIKHKKVIQGKILRKTPYFDAFF